MKKAFQRTAFILMRELSWRCFGHKIDWRRLFLLAATLTVSGIVFQMLVHSYLLNNRSPHETDSSSYPSLNSTISIKSNEFPKEAMLQQVHLSLPNSAVLLNSSNELVQYVSAESERLEARKMNSSISGSKKNKMLANTTKNTTSSFHHVVPSHKQRHIWLLSPSEALVYAKKEIDHAPSVNEDPNLYAPLFRNVSVFKR